ncbi:MAG: hypothetical protein LKM36_08840 [Flavobacteriales bacterium]|jgi:fluoride ion exporter CrcB/FEX|nr:hypothetical protein [Flavobacteriales bacterium]MCI1752953.1 hypothetical protein [Flavobacteriales bacterium]
MSIETTLVPWLLGIHATAGGIALVVAPLAMMTHKGGDWHRRWGKVFFYGMIVVCATAITLGILHPKNFWLALVAVFSFYLVASGYRSLYLKKLHKGIRPAKMDIALQGIAGLVNGSLLIWGLAHLILGTVNTQAILFTVFGLIGTLMVVSGIMKFYRQRHDKREWMYGHIGGFLGGYIATVSAFSAVNLTMIKPIWLQWLWPTIIGVPLIFLTIWRLKRRFVKGERLRSFADVRIK